MDLVLPDALDWLQYLNKKKEEVDRIVIDERVENKCPLWLPLSAAWAARRAAVDIFGIQ